MSSQTQVSSRFVGVAERREQEIAAADQYRENLQRAREAQQRENELRVQQRHEAAEAAVPEAAAALVQLVTLLERTGLGRVQLARMLERACKLADDMRGKKSWPSDTAETLVELLSATPDWKLQLLLRFF